jgi:hypothetical protein
LKFRLRAFIFNERKIIFILFNHRHLKFLNLSSEFESLKNHLNLR